MRRTLLAVLVAAFWCSAEGEAIACTQRPGNIQVTPVLESVLSSLLGVSPTLGKQCDRIAAAPLVRVMVGVLPKSEESCCRARTVLRRYPSGVLLAHVEIPSPRRREEYAELLGHEFEHILEHLEAVESDAGPRPRDTSGGGGKRIDETVRAHEAGRAVAAEVHGTRANES